MEATGGQRCRIGAPGTSSSLSHLRISPDGFISLLAYIAGNMMQRSTGSFHASVPLREVFRLPRLSSAGWTSSPDDISTYFYFHIRTHNKALPFKPNEELLIGVVCLSSSNNGQGYYESCSLRRTAQGVYPGTTDPENQRPDRHHRQGRQGTYDGPIVVSNANVVPRQRYAAGTTRTALRNRLF